METILQKWLENPSAVSLTMFLLLALWAGSKKIWTWGWVLEDKDKQLAQERADKEAWMQRALRGTAQAERALGG